MLDLVKMNDLSEVLQSLDEVRIPFDILMSSLEGQDQFIQTLLDLPPYFPGGIHIESKGLLHQQTFSIEYHWVQSNGRSITRPKRESGFLWVGDEKYLLTTHAWKIAESLDNIQKIFDSAENTHARLLVLEQMQSLKSLLPAEEQSMFNTSNEIANLKLYFANAFRLEAIPDANSYQIRPVLLRHTEHASDTPVFESILPPSEQHRYAEYFSNSTQLLPYYSLGVGKYLMLSESLNKTLKVVHRIQHASKEEKENFLKNPRAAFAEALEGEIDEIHLESIFSDRVVGIGEWSAKVIPWVQIPPNDWIPSHELPDLPKGIDIGGTRIELKTEEIESLLISVEKGEKAGLKTIEFNGTQIPVTDNTKSSLRALLPARPTLNTGSKEEPIQKTVGSNSVMLVKENLESVEFSVLRVPRNAVPSETGIPHNVRSQPKPHQIEALNWLYSHYRAGSRGVLLADDMGLGKTFQSLMFFAWLRTGIENKELSEKPLLIVAPTGLLKNWEAEIEKHLVQGLGALQRVYGHQLQGMRAGNGLNLQKLKNAGLVLTTYDTLTRYQTSFSAVSFTAVIFDEMQKLKNPGIQNYTAACSLNCDFWIGMTGTPVENRLADLWAITDVLQPGLLGSIKEFSNKYEKVMVDGGELAMQRLQELQDGLIKPVNNAPAYMLRRMKQDELPGLPIKHVHEHQLTMPVEQAAVYSDVINQLRNAENRKGAMLEALHKLRAYSLHPDYKKLKHYSSDDVFINSSARLKLCFDILDKVAANKEKALIFVEYNEWHSPDFLRNMIRARYQLKELPMVINGQVDSGARQARVDKFQLETGVFDVMLLSPRAGGVGLTLTAANHVIHLTRWWNPAVEDQATDRIYRIGQKSDVHVHYLLAIHPELPDKCFDHNLNNLLTKRRDLSKKVLIAPPNEGEMLDGLFEPIFGVGINSQSSLEESYLFSGQEYEQFVYNKLRNNSELFGYIVRKTPKSWDGGADLVIESFDAHIVAIIQCKHVSDASKTNEFSKDLERAFENYQCDRYHSVKKIGITNATRLTTADKNWNDYSKDNICLHGQDGLKPEMIFKMID
ncbi:ATP-dependent helicase [Pseudomethylobacillus aquaticus]|uniref:ATP-dependent helicase n=1 Tax=Pseudomethylobacillus aquaticus TaxID=2676064 RepID=A0A3N0V0B1_9PROT|nr:ATP-dependent helicase [Pseudomethylobacillus aquaticus]